MDDGAETTRELRIYRDERVLVGVLGTLLPWLLPLVSWLRDAPEAWLPSISEYYYSNARDVYVGVLFAVAAFMFVFRGAGRHTGWIGPLTAIGMVCSALFPVHGSTQMFHYAAAGTTFVGLGLLSAILFSREMERWWKVFYILCGVLIILCTVLVAAIVVWKEDLLANTALVFVIEAAAMMLFALSWFFKGWQDVTAQRAYAFATAASQRAK